MTTIEYRGRHIDCYGEINAHSNFHVVCEDEEDDDIWTEGNPNDENYEFSSWQEVVETLSCYFHNIEEITAV